MRPIHVFTDKRNSSPTDILVTVSSKRTLPSGWQALKVLLDLIKVSNLPALLLTGTRANLQPEGEALPLLVCNHL